MHNVTRNPNSAISTPDIAFVEDQNTGIRSPSSDKIQIVAAGVAVADYNALSGTDAWYGPMVLKITGITGAAGSSGVFDSTANPFGYDVFITNLQLRITTLSTGASTVDIGVGADATTSSDLLIDGASGAAAVVKSSAVHNGTNGVGGQIWTTTTFLNVAEASGDVDGLVATMYVTCVRA